MSQNIDWKRLNSMRKGKLNWNTFCDREKEKVHLGFYSSQFSRFLECNQQGHKAERKVYTTALRIFPSFKLWTHCFEDSMQRCFLAAPPVLPLKPVIRFHTGWIQSKQVSLDFAQFFVIKSCLMCASKSIHRSRSSFHSPCPPPQDGKPWSRSLTSLEIGTDH